MSNIKLPSLEEIKRSSKFDISGLGEGSKKELSDILCKEGCVWASGKTTFLISVGWDPFYLYIKESILTFGNSPKIYKIDKNPEIDPWLFLLEHGPKHSGINFEEEKKLIDLDAYDKFMKRIISNV